MKTSMWRQLELRRTVFLLAVSLGFFLAQLVFSHLTHSLTLLVAGYHMLYNIFSLAGCIATIKMCQRKSTLSNTFGWARLEVLSMVVNLLFLAALNFSLVVEAVQTIVQYGDKDAMHDPINVSILTAVGFAVELLCIVVIGGFTHHQGSFLTLTDGGDVKIQGQATEEAVRSGLRRLETDKEVVDTGIKSTRKWPKLRSVFRDISSSVLVLVACAIVYVYGEDSMVSVMIDPFLAILSVAILSFTSYPFMLQAGQILLQTTPEYIDVKGLESELRATFPSIVNVHDFHVWALTPGRVIATAHLMFASQSDYHAHTESISNFFLTKGITRLTLQPEFYLLVNPPPSPDVGCILPCNQDSCDSKTCCRNPLNPPTANKTDVESAMHDDHEDCHPSISVNEEEDVELEELASNDTKTKASLAESVLEPLLTKADQ